MPQFISDDEMNALEQKPGFISDEQMAQMESKPTEGLWDKAKGLYDALSPDHYHERKSIGGTPFDNPLFAVSAPGSIASSLGQKAVGALESAATSPLPTKVSNATNMVGAAKGLVSKYATPVLEQMPAPVQKIGDIVSGAIGRKAAYSNPLTAIPQGISDTAKGVSYAQKSLAYALDKAPHYAPALQKAAEAGGNALGTTMFILQQKDPEFQKVMKEMRDHLPSIDFSGDRTHNGAFEPGKYPVADLFLGMAADPSNEVNLPLKAVTNPAVVSAVGGVANKAREAVKKALSMKLADRMKRAKEMGYDTKQKWFHGTPRGPFNEFSQPDSNYPGISGFFSRDKGFAQKFADEPYYYESKIGEGADPDPHLFEVFLKNKKTFDYENPKHLERVIKRLSKDDAKDVVHSLELSPFERSMALTELAEGRIPAKLRDAMRFGDNWATIENPKILDAIKKSGFDSTFVQEEGRKNIAVFEPNQIRSVNAKFDPAKKKSGNILDTIAPITVGTGAVYGAVKSMDEKRDY